MRKILIFILILFLISCTEQNLEKLPQRQTATVIDIIDGDTYLVNLNNVDYKVRLLGVDYPDLVSDRMDNFLDLGISKNKIKYCYEKGKKEIKKILVGKNITIIPDLGEQNKDGYGRLIRYVELNNKDIG